jgi:hypothetical protein
VESVSAGAVAKGVDPNPYDASKAVLPPDAAAQVKKVCSLELPIGARSTKRKKAICYRYRNEIYGNWHWCGGSNDVTANGTPGSSRKDISPAKKK